MISEAEKRYHFDEQYRRRCPNGLLCGVDEAGRGPLCGPVSVAAVILPAGWQAEGLTDSKKLSEKKREELYEIITEAALAWSVELVGPEVVDEINIHHATLHGMRIAVEMLTPPPDFVLVDGRFFPTLLMPAEAVVKGDFMSASIAAASILAKVTRDRYMRRLDAEYPQYQLARHKGYPTKLHYELLEKYGIQPFYRKTFLRKRGL